MSTMSDLAFVAADSLKRPERWVKTLFEALRQGFGPTIIGTYIGYQAGAGIDLLWTVPGGIVAVAAALAITKFLNALADRFATRSPTNSG